MTPDERYALQRVIDAFDEAAITIKRLMDIGPNPHLSDDYRARLEAEFSRCRCDFGWQPECPAHGARVDHQHERLPGVDNTVADSMTDEQIDRFLVDPEKTRAHIENHLPTPADVFGKKAD